LIIRLQQETLLLATGRPGNGQGEPYNHMFPAHKFHPAEANPSSGTRRLGQSGIR